MKIKRSKIPFLLKTAFVVLLFCAGKMACAQTKVYPVDSNSDIDRLLTIDKSGHVLPGISMGWNESIVSVENGNIFKGFSTSFFDLLYTERDGKLYQGDITFSGDILYTYADGKIFRGDSNFPMDCIVTYTEGLVYKGDSTNYFDLLFSFGGDAPTVAQIFAVLLVLEAI